jgi:3-phenylpropionate/trans-cinnamate dioxygenase ferredoxin reductase component
VTSINRIVIVGAGLAGARAAEAARKEGYEGRITLLGAESERPYLRPPLSKDYLRRESDDDQIYVHSESFYADQRIDLRPSTQVHAVEPNTREVVLANGSRLAFDRLLLATGARARRLGIPGAELAGVMSLRTRADADALRAAAADADRIVVVGAGWTGSEVAASLRMLGRRVVLVGSGASPLERVLGPEIGRVYRDLHAQHGVELRLGTTIRRVVGRGRVNAIETAAGERIPADLVVLGIGVEPRVELGLAAGLAVGDGIEVSASLETSVPGIFAAGDVASAWHPFYETRLRSEHWANATFQGPAAAKAMLGEEVAYERLPYFYSDQYDLGMEYTGRADPSGQLIVRGSIADRQFIAFWLAAGHVVAGMNANIWNVAKPIEQLIRSRVVVDVDALTDPQVPLEELAGLLAAV